MSTSAKTPTITEVNTKLLKREDSELLEGFTAKPTNDGNHISINLEFWHYENLGHNIGSLLNAISSTNCETENGLGANDIQNVALITKQLVDKIPFQFLDGLLIKKSYNKEDFKNVKSL
ncbi:hypothetical protein [Tenacibaculum finnmarkense]|uniref:Uncharacterized protein n=1 Tax=Tenacibaculum finnmarkense genomovar ulcerans TaxID=2781388 RepID=A0A2I2M9S9_9FLAO|nr:hypothetical protein [Tenacibaculum finnmarkense]MCG8185212.1 hypothetical protein [Tenacibaculum finnmarkense genomovar finnmarkense]MCG8775694.1 hypothetical protein [Tenacibaculum finnmarkense]MCG8792232.1 hypothetical protein [Tenacibaculum finnmarkense]MCM8861763.1 hypothetical protein [Tenacibaculum finnmarkense genomovar finnmarkense]SOU89303.1 hypothetical protein TNO010_310159 [Tenacibaculum finnmarkense genomovar ulcerans]